MYEYDEQFYRYINEGSANSARKVLPILLDALPGPVESVLDVGCGAGAWLKVWSSLGAEITGLDGEYVNPDQLLIESERFVAADLSRDFFLEQRFSLVQSLEVAEHLPESSARGFVASLCRHADMVLFSAAPPGQGGENHINEQPYEFWRDLFREQGYALYDVIRPSLLSDEGVMPWYRYNSFLYINDSVSPASHQALAAFRVAENVQVADLSPGLYQLRKRLVRLLPRGANTALARLKKNAHIASARLFGAAS